MPKDSQTDNKKSKSQKSKGSTPGTNENKSKTRNSKKQSGEKNDV